MLNNTYTLGTTTSELTFTKQFPDANKSQFSVTGLAPNAARTMLVSHETLSTGRVRTMVSLDETDVNPASPTGATAQSRVYLVIDRQPYKTAQAVKDSIRRLKTLVDDTAFQDALLNREV